MVIDSLNLRLRQIVRFLSNVILDEMSSAKCRLLFGFVLIAQHEERPLYHVHVVTSHFIREYFRFEGLINGFYPAPKGDGALLHCLTDKNQLPKPLYYQVIEAALDILISLAKNRELISYMCINKEGM